MPLPNDAVSRLKRQIEHHVMRHAIVHDLTTAREAHEAQYQAFLRARRYCKGDPLSEPWRREMAKLNLAAQRVVDAGGSAWDDRALAPQRPSQRNTLRDVRKGRAGR